MNKIKRKYYVPTKSSNSTITKNMNSTLLSQDQISIQYRNRSRPQTGISNRKYQQHSSTIDYVNESYRAQSSEVDRRQKSERQLINQTIIKQIYSIDNLPYQRLLTYFSNNISSILEFIRLGKLNQLFFKLTYLIESSLHTLDIQILASILYMVAKVLYLLGDYSKSIYLFNQIRILAAYSNDNINDMRIQAFIFIGKCAQKLNQYDTSILIIKKGIQYAWYKNDKMREIELYNLLSLSYFYMGDSAKSQYFQERSLLGDYECENSPIRQLSNTFLKFQLEKNKKTLCCSKITQGLVNKLNLPIENNIINNELRDENKNYDGISKLHFQGEEILESMIKTAEYDFQIYTPRNSISNSATYYERIKNNKYLQAQFRDKRLIKMDMSTIGVIEKKQKSNKVELDSKKYKLDLDKKIKLRAKLDFSYDHVIDRCNQRVKNNLNYQSQLRNKILVSHQKKGKNEAKKLELNQAMKCVVDTLAKFINDQSIN